MGEGEHERVATVASLATWERRRDVFDTCPDFEAPRSAKRSLQRWTPCRYCAKWYAAPNKELNRGRSVYCSIGCTAAHATATGKFRGPNNPSWQGGVSNDNMRYRRRQKEREPEHERVRALTYNAIKRGVLVRQPCEACGAVKSEAHHDDYTKPLDVRWLCRAHHVAHHTTERRRKSA